MDKPVAVARGNRELENQHPEFLVLVVNGHWLPAFLHCTTDTIGNIFRGGAVVCRGRGAFRIVNALAHYVFVCF